MYSSSDYGDTTELRAQIIESEAERRNREAAAKADEMGDRPHQFLGTGTHCSGCGFHKRLHQPGRSPRAVLQKERQHPHDEDLRTESKP